MYVSQIYKKLIYNTIEDRIKYYGLHIIYNDVLYIIYFTFCSV